MTAKQTMDMDEMAEMHEGGQYTWVSDWVLALDLRPETIRLYVMMCFAAKDDESGGTRITLTRPQANAFAKGDGYAAIQELMEVGAITQVADYANGRIRFRLQDYPPKVQTLIDRRVQVDGKPVVTYG
jgi:hypothetical protein